MRPLYHEISSQLEIYTKKNTTLPPHLHKYLECIYVTEGRLRLGFGEKWEELEPHDLALIFPDMIHQFLVEEEEVSHAIYMLGTSALAGSFAGILQKYYPRTPVIRRERVHPDIIYGMNTLLCSENASYYFDLQQAYFQILLARALPECQLLEKREQKFSDLPWQMVSYISQHFMEEVSLPAMAYELGASPYVLSRIFSSVFHTNFNQYLNEIRLDYASGLLRTTERSITDIMIDAGFNSQTTFNRVFREKYHISPRDYRKQNQNMSSQVRQRLLAAGEQGGASEGIGSETPWHLVKGRFL